MKGFWCLLGLGLLSGGCRDRLPHASAPSAKTAGLDPNANAEAMGEEVLETDDRVPVVRDIYRQAALVVRSQIEASPLEERLHALATIIERETKEIP